MPTNSRIDRGEDVRLTEDTLTLDLVDGRTISIPLVWYPRLLHATAEERNRWEWIGDNDGIHWPDLEEDISVEGIIAGRRSGESQRSLKAWLEGRRAGKM
jgi:hypothetical protein